MNNALFEKTGIKLTNIQIGILKDFFWGIIKSLAIVLAVLAVAFLLHILTPDCAYTIAANFFSGSHGLSCLSHNPMVPAWASGVVVALLVWAFVPFLTHGATYLSSLVSNRDFREKEMAASVDFQEEDEREQLLTMRATRRAYMVLNFTLLVFWLVSLITGNFGTAVTLFIVQAIGAISYRHGIRG
ncbi:MAG TPA: hypothetical protein VG934_00770 [Candidatus Paceibacterota bacterium]|nr:hypothetical protein [Candidatus Paceibacterota bacterium]